MSKTWRERLFGWSRSPKRKRRYRPFFEQLEERRAPAAGTMFTWLNTDNNGKWEDANNWLGTNGMSYPGYDGTQATTNDLAAFVKTWNTNCTMAQAHTLGSFSMGGYTQTLTLQAQLTLSGGQSTMSSGTIAQTAAGVIDVQGGTTKLTWSGGDINPAGPTSTFTIEAGGTLSCSQTGATTSKFGDDLKNSGLVLLSNDTFSSIMLVNRPTITNNAGAEIRITVDNPVGITLAQGDPVVTIQNSGLIDYTGLSKGKYVIADAVNNKAATAKISTGYGIIRFKGADPTTGYSVNQSLGTIQINGGSVLWADSGLYQTGGTTIGLKGATINGNVQMLGGTLQQGDGTAGTAGILHIMGNLNFQGGTLQIYVDATQPAWGQVFVEGVGNGITINRAATSIQVGVIGANKPPAKLAEVMFAVSPGSTITGDAPMGVAGGGYSTDGIEDFGVGKHNSLWVM